MYIFLSHQSLLWRRGGMSYGTYSWLHSQVSAALKERGSEWKSKEGAALLSGSPSLFFFLSEDNRVAFIFAEWISVGLNVWLAVCRHACVRVCSLKLIRENMLSNSFHPQLEMIQISHPGPGSVVPPSGEGVYMQLRRRFPQTSPWSGLSDTLVRKGRSRQRLRPFSVLSVTFVPNTTVWTAESCQLTCWPVTSEGFSGNYFSLCAQIQTHAHTQRTLGSIRISSFYCSRRYLPLRGRQTWQQSHGTVQFLEISCISGKTVGFCVVYLLILAPLQRDQEQRSSVIQGKYLTGKRMRKQRSRLCLLLWSGVHPPHQSRSYPTTKNYFYIIVQSHNSDVQ